MSTPPSFRTALTELTGVRHPIVQTGMGWVAGPRLVTATARAGALGLIGSATMSLQQLEDAIDEVRDATDAPFGVNLRADGEDADARIDLMIRRGVKVASFALAPKESMIKRLKDAGLVVIPSIGAPRHAEKVASWGADMVMVQGGEGGGHTGPTATTILLPSVVDAVDIPVIAAGGFFDGRGLAAALSYGAVGIGMGTRFLLTSDSSVPTGVKEHYLTYGNDGTVVTPKADGMPHRLLRTTYVEGLETEGTVRRLARTASRTVQYRKMAGVGWPQLFREGLAMKAASERTWGQMILAANTPMLLKAGVVEGRLDAGMLASGQAVGAINDLPSCQELVDRIVADAVASLDRIAASRVAPVA